MKNKKIITSIFVCLVLLIVSLLLAKPTIKKLNFGLDLKGGFEVLFLRRLCGRPHLRPLRALLPGFRRHGQRLGVCVYFSVHGLCGRICAAMVFIVVLRRRGGNVSRVGTEFDSKLYAGTIYRVV